MPQVSYLNKDEADESVRPIFEQIERKLGQMPHFFQVLAHSPNSFKAFLDLDGAMKTMALEARHRELAYLGASAHNGCDYCTHYHKIFGQKAGLNDRQLSEVATFETSESFDDLQKDILRFTQQLTAQARVEQGLTQRLKQQLSERELVELAMVVALANYTNRLNVVLEVELP